ncbi:MAG: dehydrogenase, partial [Alphaproteobacteria bacterium]|nr:dehydrogenase [Alphaproteobacteria bacterium]
MATGKFRVGVPRDALDKSDNPIFDSGLLDMLTDPAVEWRYYDAPVPELSPKVAADFDALCVMGGRIGHSGLAVGRVRLIARFGVGYDNVDVAACTEHGVLLTLAPDGVRRPVATSVIALMLALAHKLLIKDKLTRAGRWAEKLDHIGTGLTGRVLGAIGMGNIGAEVFRLAQPFGLRLIAHDPLAKPVVARALGVELVDFDTVLRTADFVSVMCPLSECTRELIGPRELGLMKPTAYLINTARGPIVQE